MNEHEDSDAFSEAKHKTLNSCRSLGYARGNESIIIYNLCKPIETYIYAKKSTHLHVIPQQITQTHPT